MKIRSFMLISALLLVGCESGYDDRYAGIEGTGEKIDLASAYGTVSGFGSIYVNGVHFNTDDVSVEIDGESAMEHDLAVGMVVEVFGEIEADRQTGKAHTIQAERVLLGNIDAVEEITWGRKAIHILGQRVFVNEDTTFEGLSFSELEASIGVSVSGFVTDNGLIMATYLAQKNLDDTVDQLEVEGYIDAIDHNTQTLYLKDLSVRYAAASVSAGSVEDLVPGKRIHVFGALDGVNQMSAVHIDIKSHSNREGRVTSIEGVVREWDGNVSFVVHTSLVRIDNAVIKNGDLADIINGAQVVVFGRFEKGELLADKVHLKSLNSSRFSGSVSAIDLSAKTFIVNDTLFQVSEFTQFKDDSRRMERHFNFSDLRVGEELEIYAVIHQHAWEVTRISRKDFEADRPDFLSGEVTLIEDSSNFWIANILVDGSALPAREWEELRSAREGPVNVMVEGYYLGETQFIAVHVRIFSKSSCDSRIFFRCGDRDDMRSPRSFSWN